ncbi:MAG TPA: hypothetical protein VFD66_01315 [Verrucomicrobiae bacterium]|nr:hypothetical protein [Verrucomicrobiae bacterium]
MSSLLIGLIAVLLASNAPAAVTNLIAPSTLVSTNAASTNDPVAQELKKLMELDDAAQAEVDGWLRENDKFTASGAGIADTEMNRRIRKRFEPVHQGYEDLIKRYPTNADTRVAFASFLHDMGDNDGQVQQLEKARELNPKDPAIWNNLANYYGEFSPVKKAFEFYAKAIELDPREPVYYQNFATTVCMFRKDAKEYYHLTEQEVFDKSLSLYSKALELDPLNFQLASDLALTYYIIKPLRTEDALRAWTNALSIAHNEVEREGVNIHLARLKASVGRFSEARAHLRGVTNAVYADLKDIGTRSIEQKEKDAKETNSPPAQAQEPKAK